MIAFELQPLLENELIKIQPIKETDFEILYGVASDPLIWEQHPNKNRYKKEVFKVFFNGALESKGAFLVMDAKTSKTIGSSRYYDYDAVLKTTVIGYTFLARSYWGTTYNRALKTLMLNHAFKFVESVHFHVGSNNIRSQTAIQRLGAKKINEIPMAYYGEPEKLNFVYEIKRSNWLN